MALFSFPDMLSVCFKEKDLLLLAEIYSILLCATNIVLFGQLPQGHITGLAFLWCSLAVHLALLRSPLARQRSGGGVARQL